MLIPAIGPPPEEKGRLEMISKSDNAGLEKFRQHALGRMDSLSQPGKTAPPEYQEWSNFVGEIEAELRKRQ
jgi:hypothetical protein